MATQRTAEDELRAIRALLQFRGVPVKDGDVFAALDAFLTKDREDATELHNTHTAADLEAERQKIDQQYGELLLRSHDLEFDFLLVNGILKTNRGPIPCCLRMPVGAKPFAEKYIDHRLARFVEDPTLSGAQVRMGEVPSCCCGKPLIPEGE